MTELRRFTQRPGRRTSIGRGVVGLVLAGCVTGAAAQSGPAPMPPEEAARAKDILMQRGYASTPQGLAAAAATSDSQTLIAALNAASAVRSDVLQETALRLLNTTNFALQLAAAKYLGSLNVPAGAQVVRAFAEAKREYTLDDPNLQLLSIDAAREVARNGHPDYAFQVAFLLEQGDWDVKTFAALAMRDFHPVSDASVEDLWLRAIDIYTAAIATDEPVLRVNAHEFMRTLLESAGSLELVTTKTLAKFEELARRPMRNPPSGLRPLDLAGAVARLRTLKVEDPRDPAPPLDPDPRIVAQSASEKLLSIIDKGPWDTLTGDLDDKGQFEGLGKQEWIASIKNGWTPIPEGFDRRIRSRAVRTSQPSSREVLVEIQGDQFDAARSRWVAMTYRFRVTWWGMGWHFSGFDRQPAAQQPAPIDGLPEPPHDERYPDAQNTVLELVGALKESDIGRLTPILAQDVRINDGALERQEFLDQMARNFEQLRDLVVFRPLAYEFTPTDDPGKVRCVVKMKSFNRAQNRLADVEYELTLQRADAGWLISELSAQTQHVERP